VDGSHVVDFTGIDIFQDFGESVLVSQVTLEVMKKLSLRNIT
jgi:hypothetical protein